MVFKNKYNINQEIGDYGLLYLGESHIEPVSQRCVFIGCKCGEVFIARLGNINNNHTKSCGCYSRLRCSETHRKHGDSYTTTAGKHGYLYTLWSRIRSRCFQPTSPDYELYGHRGITVYKEWLEYISFKKWILENLGERPAGHSLDRVDNNGDYRPDNLRWATPKEQANNRRKRRWGKKP